MRKALLRGLASTLIVSAAGSSVSAAHAQSARATESTDVRSYRTPWTEREPRVLADVRAGLPFVTLVFVPLCSNAQIDCGGAGAGDPSALAKNLYWGRAFGVRRFLDGMPKTWERIAESEGAEHVLQQVVYRRRVAGARWDLEAGRDVEQLLILRAVQGDAIDRAVDDFWALAQHGGEIAFREGEHERRVRAHVAGYAGHNRLMDGKRLSAPAAGEHAAALPSFVLACRSEGYFSSALAAAGSRPLVMTRDLMAPEGYVIEALVRALGDRVSESMLRQRTVAAYAKWQRIPERTASRIFAR